MRTPHPVRRWRNRERYFACVDGYIYQFPEGSNGIPAPGQVVTRRGRRWLVTRVKPSGMWGGFWRIYGRPV
jgi:hypothetical protein